MDRRRPGQSHLVTQRKESDTIAVLSGLNEEGFVLGTPLSLMVMNEDARSKDYGEMKDKYRPSHADFGYDQKYGLRAWQGGGRSSARETVGRVAAGSVAEQWLKLTYGIEIVAWVSQVQDLECYTDISKVSRNDVDATPVRCPDLNQAEAMIARIEQIRKERDSVGGVVSCVVRGVPAGWGEPVFDKLEADLAKAVMSLPACKGFESGSGFGGVVMRGSEHNDPYQSDENKQVSTLKNNSGGIQGGISNGMPIFLRAAFKPTATIMMEQQTVTTDHENTTLSGRGRHDPCVVPRAVPMVEAMVALTLIDHALRQRGIRG
jgi:chorismate synthase